MLRFEGGDKAIGLFCKADELPALSLKKGFDDD